MKYLKLKMDFDKIVSRTVVVRWRERRRGRRARRL